MKKILIGGAGAAPSNNFISSLRAASEEFFLIGMSSVKYDLCKAKIDKAYMVPYAVEADYVPILKQIIAETTPDFFHVQNDSEVFAVSKNREQIGVKTFLPRHETVAICVDKWKSYEKWREAGIKVPRSFLINNENDLKISFKELGIPIWIRFTTGAFGRGSLPVTDYEFAKAWIDFHKGWGNFQSAEFLSPETVTFLSIWKNGKLIVGQGRKRLYWEFANRTISGVTGITGTGVTTSDPIITEIAQEAILAIDKTPDGIFGVDITYDSKGIPNLTEINIGRFFTTHHFFTAAGLNMPYIYVKLAFDEELPPIEKKLNPLPNGLAWVRGMDTEPVLTTIEDIDKFQKELEQRRERLMQNNGTF